MKSIYLLLATNFVAFNLFAQVNWKNVSTNGMGYVDGLIIHPQNNKKFVRTDVGGIFAFDDAQQKWTNLLDTLNRILQNDISSVEAFAIDKTTSGNNQVIYASCGNGFKSFMLKSSNGGNSWSINQGWYPDSIKVYGNGDWRCAGERLMIDPKNSSVVYCGTRKNGLWKTVNAGGQWNKVAAFTASGGAGGLGIAGGISFVVMDSSSLINVNGQNVSKNIYLGLIDGGVYRSNDGGNSFCYLANGFDTTQYNPVRAVFDNNRLIVATMKDGDEYGNGEVWQFVPNANDCGGTWSNKTPGLQSNFQCPAWGKYLYNAIAIRPGSPNTVFVAIRGATPRKIFYTENFDAIFPNWKIITMDGPNGYASCASNYQAVSFYAPNSWVNTEGYDWVGNIEFDQQNNKKLWITSGNGVMLMEDFSTNPVVISSLNTMKDLEILCVNTMASPPAPNTTPLLTASMDVLGIVYQNLDNGQAVKLDPSFGLGAAISLDYSFQNPNNLVLVGQDYNSPATLKRVIRSTNGGTQWQSIWTQANSCTDAPWGGNIAMSSTDPNKIVWVPSHTSTVSGCGAQVKNFPRYTTDGGVNWNFCSDINFVDGNFPFLFNSTFGIGKSLESDKVNGDKFYYYAMPGYTFVPQFWRTVNAGASWQKRSEGGILPITGGGQLKANPFVEDDIWFSPFNKYINDNDPNPNLRKLYHSIDGGVNWTTLTAISEVYAFGFGMKKTGNNFAALYVYGKINGIENIYVSNDLGASFAELGTKDIPEGIITNLEGDMKVNGRVYASTGCRGIWYGDVPNAVVLALKLLRFNGQQLNAQRNQLQWQMDCKNDLGKVELQRSEDGRIFTNIYNKILTNADCNSNMQFVDDQFSNPKNHYRLRITNTDGAITYSSVVLLQSEKEKLSAQFVPNVVVDNVALRVQSLQMTNAQILIQDATGKLVHTQMLKLLTGSQTFSIPTAQFSAGVYFAIISTDAGERVNLKFVKQ